MAEIENKPRLGSGSLEDRAGLRLDGGRGRQQYLRVEIALQGDARAYPGACPRQVGHPIQPDGAAAAAGDVLEPLAAALGEDNRGHRAARRS